MDALVEASRAELRPAAARILTAAGEVVVAAAEVRDLLRRHTAESLTSSVDDAGAHLARLVRPGFVASAGAARIDDVGRYVRGIAARLRKLPEAPRRDATNLAVVLPLERSYRDLLAALEPAQVTPRVVEAGWLLEELRVSLFAQQLGTRVPVSAARVRSELDALWAGDLWPDPAT
jgi:ATP-dependent helicase HrpA